MSISSLYLDAFMAVAKHSSFSKASKEVFVTQSALSQRIKNLEEDLGVTLFIREPSGIILTEAGEKLLRYTQTKDAIEDEFLNNLKTKNKNELAGIVKIGTYSSVMRSVIIPALSELLRKHPKIQIQLISKPMKELPQLLYRTEVNFIIMDYKLEKENIETKLLGQEEYVVIKSKKYPKINQDIYLDNNPKDMATEKFFKAQKGKKIKYKRSYLSDCYGIIDGVAEGLGKAVMPVHMINNKIPVKIERKFKPYKLDVTLHYFSQPFYSQLHQAIVNELKKNCSKIISLK